MYRAIRSALYAVDVSLNAALYVIAWGANESLAHQNTYRSILTESEACFVSYVNISIKFEARRLMKRSHVRQQKQVPLLSLELDRPQDRALIKIDEFCMAEDCLEDVITDCRVQQAVLGLTHSQRAILYKVIVRGQTEREIAVELNVSQQAISKIKKLALSKLRAALAAAS